MAETTTGIHRPLSLSPIYRSFQRIIRPVRFYEEIVDRYLQTRPGQRILDVGCGPGTLLAHLPDVDYLGIDISDTYLTTARRRFGERGRFRNLSATQMDQLDEPPFDVAVATGLLHHLDDEGCRRVLEQTRDRLRPGGRFLAVDGCFTPRQSRLTRFFLEHDRGRHIRTEAAYRALAAPFFPEIEIEIRADLVRVIPYVLSMMTCVRR